MSERFLEGFVVDLKALDALIGTPKLAAKAVRKKVGRKPIVRDLEMTLAESYDDDEADEGGKMLDALLDALAKGRPTRKHDAYEMVRVSALILTAYATRLGTIETMPHVEGDDFGLLTPVLNELGLAQMAKDYGYTLLAFPYKKPADVDWPIVMSIAGPALAKWKTELATDWKKNLPKVSDKAFTDAKYGTSPESIEMTRSEIPPVLAKLKTWVGKATAQKGRALVLILDGDQ